MLFQYFAVVLFLEYYIKYVNIQYINYFFYASYVVLQFSSQIMFELYGFIDYDCEYIISHQISTNSGKIEAICMDGNKGSL